MATLNVSLPNQLREWVTQKVEDGTYSSASDYLRDLIRSDKRSQEEGTKWLSDHLQSRLDTPEEQYIESSAAQVKARARRKFGISK